MSGCGCLMTLYGELLGGHCLKKDGDNVQPWHGVLRGNLQGFPLSLPIALGTEVRGNCFSEELSCPF